MFLTGRTAIVTGSTSGIGAAIARTLASEGAAVMTNGFGDADAIAAQCAELARLSGAKAIHDGADLTDPAAIDQLARRCVDEMGEPDIIINNAGIQHVSPIEDFPPEQYEKIVALNMSAAFYLTRAVVAGMKARKWGRIISTASAHSLVASPNKSAYVMAKHGVAGMTKAVALETAPHGVTVNCISPGYVWTPLVEGQIPDTMATRGLTREQVINDVLLAAQPTKQFVTPDQVAALVLFLCRDEAAAITGANLSMDGGWTAA